MAEGDAAASHHITVTESELVASATTSTAGTSTVWPCRCGAQGVKNLGTFGYCAVCLDALLDTFNPASFGGIGRWTQAGALRGDFGAGFADCRCRTCTATAVAIVGRVCDYCVGHVERLATWQAEQVLTAPDFDSDDRDGDRMLKAWADRMVVAVQAGIVTETAVRRVWDRTVRDGH